MTKRLGQMIDEGKIDLDQYLIMHPFSASTKKVYEEALRGIDFFNELYIKNNKTYERLAIISKVFNNAERNLVVVTGYRGCGKTNFLKLVQYISDGNKPLEGFEERRKKDLENTDNINDVNEKYAISLQVIKRILFNELHGLNEENSSDALTNYIYEHLAGKCKYINFDEGGMGKDKPFSEKLCYNMRRSVDNHTHDGRLAEIVSKVDDFFRRNRWTIEENFVEIDFGAIKNFWDTVKPELAQEESDSVYETLLSELKKLSLEQLLFVYTIWEYAEIITANRLPNERKLTYLLDNIDIISDGTTDIFKNTMMGIWRFVWDTKNVFLKIHEKGDVKDQAFIELYDKTNIVVAMRETTAMHISGHLRDRMREIMDHFDMSEDVDKTVVMQKKLDFALDMIKNGEVKKTGFIETVNCLNQIIDDKLFMKNIFLLFDNDYRTAMRCIKAICTEHLNEVENAIGLIKADDNHCVFGGRGIIYRLLIDHFFKWKYFDDMGIPSTKYGSSSVLMKPHHGYSYARIILTILCNRQTKNIERFFVNPEESVKLDDLYQMVRNLMNLDQFVTVINGMYSLRNKKFWNHLVTFDNILAYSSTAIKNYIESAEERFNKESSDTRDEREIYIRATTAGQMFASTMCIHFEYFSSRFSTAGISQPLFLYQNLDDKKEYKSMKDTVVAVIEAVKKCIMSLEEYNKIVMKENGASHYSEILESSYYYEGQFHEERIIHNHISYMEAYRKYVLENEKISEHRRIEANDFILDSIEKYLAMLKYNPDNGIKPYRNMFYTENSSNLYNQLMVCIEEIRDKKRYDISITRDYYNANFSGKKCRYMQNLGDVNA